jgi:hypothetical protein
MDRPCKALDRARRHVDDAMIFVSLMVLAWPLEFGEWDDQTPNVVGVILPSTRRSAPPWCWPP